MNIDPTNDFLNFPNWSSFVFEINGLNVQSEARDPSAVNALQSECPDNCSSCPLVYSFQVKLLIIKEVPNMILDVENPKHAEWSYKWPK